MAKPKQRSRAPRLWQLVWIALVGTAVVKELRKPAQDREWHGTVAGFVPYDFRVPTLTRYRSRLWAPHDEHVIQPQPFGVGWTLNVGRVVQLARERRKAP